MSAFGAPAVAANAGQAAALCLSAALVFRAFHCPLPGDQKIAVFLAGTILAAPHSSLHDAVMLAIAVALWVSGSAQSDQSIWKWPLALALWLAPLFNPPLISTIGRFAPIGIIAFIAAALAHQSSRRRVPNVA